MIRYSLIGVLLGATLAASTLEVYSDRSFYEYQPAYPFIGFAKGVSAEDDHGTLALSSPVSCERESELCALQAQIQKEEQMQQQLQREQKNIAMLLERRQDQSALDAASLLAGAKAVAARMSEIDAKLETLKRSIQSAKARFGARSTSSEAVAFETLPAKPVRLLIPSGIAFESRYLLDLDRAVLQHDLLLTNRSGIDIKADTMRLFDMRAGHIRPPTVFYPRTVRIAPPRNEAVMRGKAMAMDMAVMAEAMPMAAPVKEETRRYLLENVTLPSDAREHRLAVERAPLKPERALEWHAYESSEVFDTVRFVPESVMEAASVELRSGGRRIQNAPIVRENDTIRVNVAVDYDIETRRRPMVDFSQEKGFFGSDTLKQEGFTLALVNHAAHAAHITVIERLPVSTDEQIVVRLEGLRENGADIPYTLDPETGRLEFDVALEAGKTREFSYSYSLRYPKEARIIY